MQHGNVKWFDPGRGIGSIEPEDGDEITVKISALKRSGLSTLHEGQVVAFDLEWHQGQAVADQLKVL